MNYKTSQNKKEQPAEPSPSIHQVTATLCLHRTTTHAQPSLTITTAQLAIRAIQQCQQTKNKSRTHSLNPNFRFLTKICPSCPNVPFRVCNGIALLIPAVFFTGIYFEFFTELSSPFSILLCFEKHGFTII